MSICVAYSFKVPVWSGVDIGGARLSTLGANLGEADGPQELCKVHESVVRRYAHFQFQSQVANQSYDSYRYQFIL